MSSEDSFWSFFFETKIEHDISDEKMEEYKMISGFKSKEIARIRQEFLRITGGAERLPRDVFMKIQCIEINPLRERICVCFGYNKTDSLDFQMFLTGMAAFNSPGLKQQKLRIAFRLQDFDDDGVLSKDDMTQYMECITGAKTQHIFTVA